ncbi:type II secretion system F family protein [Desulfovibrio ferrophilus]|uniref:Type II secretion system protein n=1 Tax=Desulfovibrio ferrophilus TaxID=241368 RepID=A0A2Z6AYA0_9BACT|nr:type II secretion system F family protein [Desulfovibrio ferrophilus]BBD08126.1 type II secretion system protein [Desulfovibrio ferrophilus]
MNDTMLLPLAAAGLAFASILLLTLGVSGMVGNKNRVSRLRERLEGKRAPKKPGLTATLTQGARQLGERLGPKDESELSETGEMLIQAGYRNSTAPKIFWGVKVCLTLMGLIAALGAKMLAPVQIPNGLLALLFVVPMFMGMYLPNIWLRIKVKKRRREIINAMPDALDLLVVCVEAGMGLDQALARVSNEMRLTSPILASELHTVILELRAGKTRADALRNLAGRVGVDDVTSLVTLLVQADSFGTSVAQTLRVYSDALRTTRYQRAEEIAAKMPVKILFPLIFFILPSLLVAIMGPAGLKMVKLFATMK